SGSHKAGREGRRYAAGLAGRMAAPGGRVSRDFAGPMREQLFHLDPKASATLQTQLRQMLVAAIREGQLPPGSALPSCRRLAETLDLARNTVAPAHPDL